MKKWIIITLLLPNISFAVGNATGKISGYVINEGHVFVQSTGVINDKPTCNTSNRFYFSQSQPYADAFLSAIISSYHSNTDLILSGTGGCSGINSEELRKICTPDVPC